MIYEISLTVNVDTAEDELKTFCQLMAQRGFDTKPAKPREGYSSKKYYPITLTDIGIVNSHGGGRPRKLTSEQIEEIRRRLTTGGCNKSALAREYGVSYQTIHKISK